MATSLLLSTAAAHLANPKFTPLSLLPRRRLRVVAFLFPFLLPPSHRTTFSSLLLPLFSFFLSFPCPTTRRSHTPAFTPPRRRPQPLYSLPRRRPATRSRAFVGFSFLTKCISSENSEHSWSKSVVEAESIVMDSGGHGSRRWMAAV
ncbi:hypothetical protein AKJ16_DCAP22370 [Drosera capensis]